MIWRRSAGFIPSDGKMLSNDFEDNLRARSFYEKHGFSWNGERIPNHIGGKELIELRYVWEAP